uniref:DUF4220 domain-containing protein n=1 Tax=Oryza barthii TaxID=65489 RepID=A0A0D3FS90_9ORYZ
MFVVGFFKYGERVLALYKGHVSTIRSNIDKQKRDKLKKKEEKAGDEGRRAKSSALSTKDPDYALLQAHANFSACKAALVDISSAEESTLQEWSWPNTWIVLQMEVSLLYDIMYTKAGVIHTWHGYFLRVFSLLATAAALLLFHLSLGTSSSHGDVLVDVAITYALLVGSILMDTWWLLAAAGSTWAYASLLRMPRRGRLYHAAVCSGRWRQVRRVLRWIRRIVNAEDSRRWSGTIWQYSMLQYCTRDDSKDVWYNRAKKILHVEWRKKEHRYSGTTVIPDLVMEPVFNSLLKILQVDDNESRNEIEPLGHNGNEDVPPSYDPDNPMDSMGLLKAERGLRALRQAAIKHDKNIYLKFGRFIRGEVQEQIIIWHIATDIYLRTRKEDT